MDENNIICVNICLLYLPKKKIAFLLFCPLFLSAISALSLYTRTKEFFYSLCPFVYPFICCRHDINVLRIAVIFWVSFHRCSWHWHTLLRPEGHYRDFPRWSLRPEPRNLMTMASAPQIFFPARLTFSPVGVRRRAGHGPGRVSWGRVVDGPQTPPPSLHREVQL